nr:MAG: putative RNA-dependent RNA polymerase [Narnaviridae sp.]
MNQSEFPIGDRIELLPISILSNVNKLSKTEKVNLYFSFLQSKSLCQKVPESFIQETLEKHRIQLSTPHKGVSSETLEKLREEGRLFGKVVKKYFKPNHGFFPTNKATFQFPRNIGGMKGDLIFNKRLSNNDEIDPLDRPEPFVIGLFGQPGQGKSLFINTLISYLQSSFFRGINSEQLCYMRTSNCKHWDGYSGQPIVILDDLGQSKLGLDIQEFQTLVSCNPYILPMADLKEKGTYFTSSVIITTSNLIYGHRLLELYENNSGIIDPRSFWRRFHLPLLVEDFTLFHLKEDPLWIDSSNLIGQSNRKTPYSLKMKNLFSKYGNSFSSKLISGHYINNISVDKERWEELSEKKLFSIINKLYKERSKFFENTRKTWNQKVVSEICSYKDLLGKDLIEDQLKYFTDFPDGLLMESLNYTDSELQCCLKFDAFPPSHPLEVRVEPIVEPLKVRTITAGRGELFCLKPLQRAMWLAMGEFPQYVLTHGTNNLEPAIERIFKQSTEGDVWISGDYTAATDSVDLQASKAIMEGILSEIDHLPTKRWAMKELSPHLLFYPKSSGLSPVLQESGQLMGSLLSFPLLCILNNATAKFSGLKDHQYLINGDDILMRTKPETYPLWKKQVSEFGLELSLGKNYISPEFGTVNSQLIQNGIVLSSGKQRLLDRRYKVLGECLRDLEIQMDKNTSIEVQDLFKQFNKKKLSKTVRSISVPVSHGGLSFQWGLRSKDKKTLRTEILVYLHDLFKKIEPLAGHISFPYLSANEFKSLDLESQNKSFNLPVSNKEYLEDYLERPSLEKVNVRCKNHPSLRNCFLEKKLEDLPPLSFLQVKQIPFSKENRLEVQKSIDSIFLKTFLNYEGKYDYDQFRQRTLKTHLGIKQEDISKEYLFNLYDCEIPYNLLDEIDYFHESKSSRFDSDIFIHRLGTDLKPKDFNIPSIKADDFSEEIHCLEQLFTQQIGSEFSDFIEEFEIMTNKNLFLMEILFTVSLVNKTDTITLD